MPRTRWRHDMAQHDMAWNGMTWHNIAWHHMTWHITRHDTRLKWLDFILRAHRGQALKDCKPDNCTIRFCFPKIVCCCYQPLPTHTLFLWQKALPFHCPMFHNRILSPRWWAFLPLPTEWSLSLVFTTSQWSYLLRSEYESTRCSYGIRVRNKRMI